MATGAPRHSWNDFASGGTPITAAKLNEIEQDVADALATANAAPTQASVNGKQPLDSDLTAIAALAPADGSFLGRQSGSWTGRTPAQVRGDLGVQIAPEKVLFPSGDTTGVTDKAAINSAISTLSTAGGGTVRLAPGTWWANYLSPRSNVTLAGYGSATILRSPTSDPAISASTIAFTDFAVESLTFVGTVNEFPVVPKRGRTTSGPGLTCAVAMSGDLNTDETGNAQLTNFTMRNCTVKNCSGLPILLRGVRGTVRVIDNEFTNNKDVGFTFCQEVIFSNNHVAMSADNGVSLSRGCTKVTCSGNTFENCCYHAIWGAGFLADVGATNVSITGNTAKVLGKSGVFLDAAPKYGTVAGNELDGGWYRGPSDELDDGNSAGVYLGGYPTTSRATPTDYAQGWSVIGNHIRAFARAGVYLTGVRRASVIGNQISDIGTQYLADGSTAIASSDLTQNIGILIDTPSTSAQLLIGLNHITDSRATPYCNWGIVPVSSSVADTFYNTMYGCRNTYNLVDNGQLKNINYAPIFTANTKHVAGGTAGASAASGLVAGWDTNGAAGSTRVTRWLTAGTERWRGGADATAEGGSNAGSDWILSSFDDAGTSLATVLRLTRRGTVTLGVQSQQLLLPPRVVSGAASVTVAAGAQASAASAAGNGANDTAGTLNITAGAAATAGNLVAVTFATAYTAVPHVVITPTNQASAVCTPYVTNRSATGFTVAANVAPGASASLQFDYHVIG